MGILRSIPFKLSLLSSLFVLAVIGHMAQRVFSQIERSLVAEMGLRAEFLARSCREALVPRVETFTLHFNVKEALKEKAVLRASVLDEDGKILSHSSPERIGEIDRSVLGGASLAASGVLVQEYTDPVTGEEWFDVSAPIIVVSRRVGTVRLGFSRASVAEALAGPRRQILIIALAAIAMAVLGTTLIVNWIIRPLPRLAAAAREMGKGNFDVSVECRSRDEIGTLARSFNDMAVANALLFKSLREEKEKLQTVFDQTHEALLLTDGDGRILLTNGAVQRLIGAEGGLPGTLSDYFAGFEAEPALEAVLSSAEKILSCEFVRREPKRYVLAGARERLGEGPPVFLFILHDATQERREARLEKNFLSLVSHKLRTPLMIVMNYVDLLQEEPEALDEMQSKALKKMGEQVEQLRVLVEKLLAYTAAQSKETLLLQRTETELASSVEAALKALGPLIEERGAEVRWGKEAMRLLPKLHADGYLIQEALKALIENALKFNPNKDREVRIDAEKRDGSLRVEVADNGPGIPAEEHPKLFKKFYQIDDDFTGQIMGLGLGLAFVKNVVEAHGGEAGLRSEPGKGSVFHFTLPLGMV